MTEKKRPPAEKAIRLPLTFDEAPTMVAVGGKPTVRPITRPKVSKKSKKVAK